MGLWYRGPKRDTFRIFRCLKMCCPENLLAQKNDVGCKDLNALLDLAFCFLLIGYHTNSMLCLREYITVYDCKVSNAKDVTHKDEAVGWGRKRDWPMEDTSFCFEK
jgi:hypothetical protein